MPRIASENYSFLPRLKVDKLVGPFATQQSQSVILFGDSYAESQDFPAPPYFGDTLSISLYRFVLGNFGTSFNVVRNAGISGNTAEMMLARYDTDVKPFKSEWVFFNCGVNDFYGFGYSANKVFGEVVQILDKLIADGRRVMMTNCAPQISTRSGFTAAKSTQCAIYNRLIADYVKTISGVVLVDIYSELLDWNDTTNAGALPQFFGSDGIHLSVLGTIKCAKAINQRLLPFASYGLIQSVSPLDLGIGGAESILAGTAGSNNTGSSGSVATGWTSRRASGSNGDVVCSKLSPVGQRQTITLIGTNGDSRYRLNNDLDTEFAAHVGKTVTTTIRGRCRTTSGGVHLKEFVLKLYLFDNTTITNATNGTAYSGYSPLADHPFDTGEFVVTLRDIVIPSPLGDSGIYVELLLNSVAGGVVELDIYGVDIREA
jgi:lysophospholipase L1-like esterase